MPRNGLDPTWLAIRSLGILACSALSAILQGRRDDACPSDRNDGSWSMARAKNTIPSGETDLSRKTKTLPDEQRAPQFDGIDLVTAILVYGSDRVIDLPRAMKRFTLGAEASCDVVIASEFLSALHIVMERRGSKLRVIDQDTKNGTYFAGQREAAFDARPGDTFTAGATKLLVMNDEMRAAYPTLVELLGGDEELALYTEQFQSKPSDVIVAAVTTRNLLITGEPGCDHVRLARTIHEVSLLRERPVVELDQLPAPTDRLRQRQILDSAARSTLILRLDETSESLDSTFVSSLFSTSFRVRLMVCAPSYEVAARVLRETRARELGHITLLPLTRRFRGSMCRLLDRFLAERGDLRTKNLTSSNQAAIEAYAWPNNFDDLRWVANWLPRVHAHDSLRSAAEELKVSQSTIHRWLLKVGLSLPLTPKGT